MLFIKLKMADCLTYWSYSGDDFCRPWNPCYDESAFTDEEGKEDTSLLDDLAEAKRRHISTDDIDNDADTVSLWDDVFDEQWTTKDSNSGPTLAELNGGELTDVEHYEPLKIARKRKRSDSTSASTPQQNAGRSVTRVKLANVNTSDPVFETVKQTQVATGKCTNDEVGLLCNQQRSVSLEELQDVKGTSPLEPDDRVIQSGCLLVCDRQLKSASLLHQPKVDSPDACRTDNSHSIQVFPSTMEHSLELTASRSVSKKMRAKSNHRGSKHIHYALVMQMQVFDQTCIVLSTIVSFGECNY